MNDNTRTFWDTHEIQPPVFHHSDKPYLCYNLTLTVDAFCDPGNWKYVTYEELEKLYNNVLEGRGIVGVHKFTWELSTKPPLPPPSFAFNAYIAPVLAYARKRPDVAKDDRRFLQFFIMIQQYLRDLDFKL